MNVSNKVFCGYLFEWYPQVDPTTIPLEYNMIVVAFLGERPDGLPTFEPLANYLTQERFIEAVELWKSQGREVLISLGGGQNDTVALRLDQKQAFKDEIRDVVQKYGFTGFDIDLEGLSIEAADNSSVIPAVLNELKREFNQQGRKFLITMAPEFPYLREPNVASYKPYLDKTEYDLIFPQFYNQGSDGIWTGEFGYLTQIDDEQKGPFLYSMCKAMINGTSGYYQIPADKLAIGLPASPDAALNGYVKDPSAVQYALDRLRNEDMDIRGLMTWSINQDSVNGYEFVQRYAHML